MAVAALVTVSCDGVLDVGCTADGGDPFLTIGQAVRALRAGGWTFPAGRNAAGNRPAYCPTCSTRRRRAAAKGST